MPPEARRERPAGTRHRRNVHRRGRRAEREPRLGKGGDHPPRPERLLHGGRRARRRAVRDQSCRHRAGCRGAHLLDHRRDEHAHRAVRPEARSADDDGVRGHAQGRAVAQLGGRDAAGGAVREGTRAQAGAAHPARRVHREPARAHRQPRAGAHPARQGRGAEPGAAARGPRRARVRRRPAQLVHQPGAREPRTGPDPRGVPGGLPGADARVPLARGLAADGRVPPEPDDDHRRVPAREYRGAHPRHRQRPAGHGLSQAAVPREVHRRHLVGLAHAPRPPAGQRTGSRRVRRPRARRGVRPTQRAAHRHGRHEFRRGAGRRGAGPALRIGPGVRPVAGAGAGHRALVDRRRRREHRLHRGPEAACRAAQRALASRPGLLRQGRHGTDRDGRRRGARLHRPGLLPRRPHQARRGTRRRGGADTGRGAARHDGGRGRVAYPPPDRRHHGAGAVHAHGAQFRHRPPGVHGVRRGRRGAGARGGLRRVRRRPAHRAAAVRGRVRRVRHALHGPRADLREGTEGRYPDAGRHRVRPCGGGGAQRRDRGAAGQRAEGYRGRGARP